MNRRLIMADNPNIIQQQLQQRLEEAKRSQHELERQSNQNSNTNGVAVSTGNNDVRATVGLKFGFKEGAQTIDASKAGNIKINGSKDSAINIGRGIQAGGDVQDVNTGVKICRIS